MPAKYRIAIIVDRWSEGGVPVVIQAHCKYLTERGHNVKVITYYPSEKPKDLLGDFISLGAKNRGDVRVILRLWRLLRTWHPDVIHDHFGGLWAGAFLYRGRWHRRTVLHYHNEFKAVSGSPDKNRKLRDAFFLRYLLPRYRKTLTVSQHNMQRLLENSPVDPDRISVCYNTIDADEFRRQRGFGEDIRNKLNIPDDAIFLGSIGRMVYEKGFDTVVATLIAMHKKNQKAYAVIAGDGDQNIIDSLQRQAEEAGVASFLRLLPREPNTADYLRALDFFLMCSRQEPFGLTILEAMASKTMVIGVLPEAGGGPSEIIENGKNGWLLSERDPDALADKVIEMHTKKDEAKAMIVRAEEMLTRFEPSQLVTQLEELYRYVVSVK